MESHAASHAAEIDKHVRTYIMVFVALLALTVVTVAVSYLHLEVHEAIAVALVIAMLQGVAGGALLHAPDLRAPSDPPHPGPHGGVLRGPARCLPMITNLDHIHDLRATAVSDAMGAQEHPSALHLDGDRARARVRSVVRVDVPQSRAAGGMLVGRRGLVRRRRIGLAAVRPLVPEKGEGSTMKLSAGPHGSPAPHWRRGC